MKTKTRTRWMVLPGLAALVAALAVVWTGCSPRESAPSAEAKDAATALLVVEPGFAPHPETIATRYETVSRDMLDQYMGTQVERLRSREVLQTALSPDVASIITSALTPGERMSNDEGLRARVKDIQDQKAKCLGEKDPVGRLQELLQTRPVEKTFLIKVQFKSADRRFAADLVNTVVESYLVDYKKNRKDRERRFLAGLVDQKMTLQPKLDEAERSLTTFKRENTIFPTQQAGDVTGQMTLYQDALAKADLERIQAEIMKNQLEHQLQDAPLAPELALKIDGDSLLTQLKTRELELLRDKAGLLATKDMKPDSEAMKVHDAQIAAIKAQIEDRKTELQTTLLAEQKQHVESDYESAKAKYQQISEKYQRVMLDALDKSERNVKYDILRGQYDKLQDETKLLDSAITNAAISAEVPANSVSVMSWATVPPAK